MFGDDGRQTGRRRRLTAMLRLAGLAIATAVIMEIAPVPDGVRIVAAALALATIGLAWRTSIALSQEERRQRRHAEATIDLAGSMLVAVDRECRIRMANPAACAVVGQPEDDLLGHTLQDAMLTAPEREASYAAFRAIMAGEIDAREHSSDRVIRRPDGSERLIRWHIAVRHDADGGIVGLLLSGEDMTAERERERLRLRDRADLEQLRALAQDVAASDDARKAVVHRIRRLLEADLVVLGEATDAGGLAHTAATAPDLVGTGVPAGAQSVALAVLADGEARFVANAADDSGVNPAMVAATGAVSIRFEPIRLGDEVVGVLVVAWGVPTEAVDERRAQLLALAADETGIAMRRVETLQRLKTVALTDPLTGVPNRRAFDAELERAIARARRSGTPLSLAVLDLNEFKALNDRRGHDAGDAVLAACAGAWEAELRSTDMLARLGGDEFAAILADCGATDALPVVRRLRDATPHEPGSGAGVATWNGESAFELYQLADRALYADKARRQATRIRDPERVAAVAATGLWDGGHSPAVEAIAAEARDLLGLDGVYVNLVGAEWLAHLSAPEGAGDGLPVADSYCQHVVTSGRPFVVEDARDVSALSGNPSVAAGAIAYAGMPLSDTSGHVLGALCAADTEPHAWSASELRVLDRLALRVSRELTSSAVA